MALSWASRRICIECRKWTPVISNAPPHAYPFLDRAPWMAIEAGLAITLTVLACSLLGDAIRDYLDPRLREQ